METKGVLRKKEIPNSQGVTPHISGFVRAYLVSAGINYRVKSWSHPWKYHSERISKTEFYFTFGVLVVRIAPLP